MRTVLRTVGSVVCICLVGAADRGSGEDAWTLEANRDLQRLPTVAATRPLNSKAPPERLPPTMVGHSTTATTAKPPLPLKPGAYQATVPPRSRTIETVRPSTGEANIGQRTLDAANLATPTPTGSIFQSNLGPSPRGPHASSWSGGSFEPQLTVRRPTAAHPYGEAPPLGMTSTEARGSLPMFRDVPVADVGTPAVDFRAPALRLDVAPAAQGTAHAQSATAALQPLVATPWQEQGARKSVVSVEVAQFAEQQIEEGYQLAMRGATHSARARFTRALEIVADALDMTEGGNIHRDALWDAITAMQEAKDFLPLRTQRHRAQLGNAVEVHKTTVLKSRSDIDEIAAMEALQLYFTYAAKQLNVAGGTTPVASHALYQLGKLTPLLEKTSLTTPTSYAYYQAALEVDQQNYLAANELGVLLANMGYLDASQATLRHSLTIQPSPAVWHNLAVVHKRKGEHDLAAQAQQQGQQLSVASGQLSPNQVNPIVWLPNADFARVGHPGRNRPNASRRR